MKTKGKARRISWDQRENLICVHLVNHGLHARAIASATGLSVCQVYYRAHRVGIHLRDYRDGKGPVAATLIRKYQIHNISGAYSKSLKKNLTPVIERRLQERSK